MKIYESKWYLEFKKSQEFIIAFYSGYAYSFGLIPFIKAFLLLCFVFTLINLIVVGITYIVEKES